LKAQTDKLQQEASQRFQTPSSTPSDGLAAPSSDPNDVPKEELIALCVKMSKKVKSLQQTKKDLTAALQNQNSVQSEFLSFFTAEVVMDVDMTNHGDSTSDPPSGYGPRVANVGVLKNAWREVRPSDKLATPYLATKTTRELLLPYKIPPLRNQRNNPHPSPQPFSRFASLIAG